MNNEKIRFEVIVGPATVVVEVEAETSLATTLQECETSADLLYVLAQISTISHGLTVVGPLTDAMAQRHAQFQSLQHRAALLGLSIEEVQQLSSTLVFSTAD